MKDQSVLSVFNILTLFIALSASFISPTTLANSNDNGESRLQSAIEMRKSNRLSDAIRVLEKLTEQYPENKKAKVELVVAYNQNGQYGKAQALANKVRSDERNSDKLNASLDRFLSSLPKTIASSQSVFPIVMVGLEFTDNVTGGSGNESVPPVSLGKTALRHNDMATLTRLGLFHQYRPGVEAGNTAMLWRSTINIYDRNYRDYNDYNFRSVVIGTGPYWSKKGDWDFELPTSYAWNSFDGSKMSESFNIAPKWTHHLAAGKYSPYASAHWSRNNYDNQYVGLDDIVTGINGGLAWKANENLSLTPFAGFERSNASDDVYSRESWSLGLSGEYLYSSGTVMRAGLQRKDSDYDNTDRSFNRKRSEQQDEVWLQLNHQFSSGWRVMLRYAHKNTDSNIGVYDNYENKITVHIIPAIF